MRRGGVISRFGRCPMPKDRHPTPLRIPLRCMRSDPPPPGEGEAKLQPVILMHPNDPKLRSFIPVDPTSDFPIQILPYGVFSARGLAPRVGVAIGDHVLDLWELEQDGRFAFGEIGMFSQASLNAFMALGPKMWSKTRARISELLRHDHPELRDNDELRKLALVPMRDVKLHMPFAVSGYTDF